MNKAQFHFRLGIFTLGAVAFAIAGVLLLGRGDWFRQTFVAETYFDQSVSGLSVGAPVRHRGVDIGRVTKIGFVTSKYKINPLAAGSDPRQKYNMANLILVEMTIDQEAVQPLGAPGAVPDSAAAAMVTDGLRLKLVTSLLGGGGYIDADFEKDPSRYPPPSITWTPTDVYIPSVPSGASRLIETLDDIAGDIERAHPGDLVKHVDALILDMTRVTHGIDSAQLQSRLNSTISDVQKAVGSAQQILDNPDIKSMLTSASGAAFNIRALTDPEKSKVAKLIDDLRETNRALNSLLTDPALKQAISNTGPMTNDLRALLQSAQSFSAASRRTLRK